MSITREEPQDELSGKSEFKGTIPCPGEPGSEEYTYRAVTVDTVTEEFGRFDRMKHQLDYGVAKKNGRQVLMGIKKDVHEKRLRDRGRQSEKWLMSKNKTKQEGDGSGTSETFEVQKGGFPEN